MSKLGNFDTWLNNTEVLINMIKQIGRNTPQEMIIYTSPSFSFRYQPEIRNTTTYRYKTKVDPLSNSKLASQYGVSGGVVGSSTISGIQGPSSNPYMVPSAMLGSQIQPPAIDEIVINCSAGMKINYIYWIRKNSSGMGIFSTSETSQFDYQDGGIVRNSFLFLPDNKIMIDNVIYEQNSPEAFNQDISSTDADPDIKFLDILHFRSQYADGLF